MTSGSLSMNPGSAHSMSTCLREAVEACTNYKFKAKFADCENLVGEIFGSCHALVKHKGTGIC